MDYSPLVDKRQPRQDVTSDAANPRGRHRPTSLEELPEGERLIGKDEDVLAVVVTEGLQERNDAPVGEGLERLDLVAGIVRFRRVGVDYFEGVARVGGQGREGAGRGVVDSRGHAAAYRGAGGVGAYGEAGGGRGRAEQDGGCGFGCRERGLPGGGVASGVIFVLEHR